MFRHLSRLVRVTPPMWTNVNKRDNRVRLSLECLEDRLTPATFMVSGLGDAGQGFGNTGDLRYCINQANASKDATNQINIMLDGTISLNSALPAITSNVTIDPGSHDVTVKGNGNAGNSYRIFTINSTANVAIDNLWITGGFDDGASGGGGILNDGTLTLQGDYVENNTTAGSGGGIYNALNAQLTLSDVSLTNNTAQNNGGGLENVGGTVTICCGTNILANIASTGIGGGISNLGADTTKGTIVCEDDTTMISGNSAASAGGGVANGSNGSFTMYGGLISANDGGSMGGGMYNGNKGFMYLENGVTVQNNSASNFGGGMYLANGSGTTLDGVTVQNNKLNNAGKGVGVYQQTGAVINPDPPNLTDADDPGGVPVQGN